MELDQLRYFVKVCEVKNFTRAAEELVMSQPALSRSVQRLEDEFGVPLLTRKSRTLELTAAGELFRTRALQILAIVDDTRNEIGDDGRTGRIRVGAIPTIAPYYLPDRLRDFARDFPEAHVIIHEDTTKNLLAACSGGDLDVAVLALPIAHRYLEVVELFDEELLLVLPKQHRLADHEQVSLGEIESEPFVMLDEAHCLSENVLSFCSQKRFQPVSVGKTNQLSMVQELVSLGHGVSLIPKMAQVVDSSDDRVYRSISGLTPKRTIAVTWDPYRFQSRLTRAFVNCLKSCSTHRGV